MFALSNPTRPESVPGRRGWSHVAALLLTLALPTSNVEAKTFRVTSTADDGSAGTLRWAINQANLAGAGTHNIRFNLPANSTISLTSQLPSLNNSSGTINIVGSGANGPVVSGASPDQVFVIQSGTTFIRNLKIAGTGGLTKDGAGALTRIGVAASYTGDTLINDGALNYNASGTIPATSRVSIGDGNGTAGSAVLNINRPMSAAQALDATLESDGVLVQGNRRIVRLSSVSGSAGELRLNARPNLFEITGTGGDSTFGGRITGGKASGSFNPNSASRLTKSGSSTLTLTGSSTYVARTFINDGSLQVESDTALGATGANNATFVYGSGSLGLAENVSIAERLYINGLGSGGGAIRNISGDNTITGDVTLGWKGGPVKASDATIGADFGSTLTIDGTIDGKKGLTKVGGGNLVLNGNNTYTGATLVDEGLFAINGMLTSDTTVGSSGALGGIGTIAGDVINQGVVAAGNSIGTLTVNGNYTQAVGSSLQVEINDGGTTPGVNQDLLQTQDATLNGGTVQVLAEPGSYSDGSVYRFLSSTSTIQGQFDGIQTNLPNFDAMLGYGFDSGLYWAYFTLVANAPDYWQVARTRNQMAVANYLDNIAPGATGDLSTVLSGLNTLRGDPAAMRAAFDTMNAQVGPTLAMVQLQSTTLVMQQLAGQIGSRRFSSGASRRDAASDSVDAGASPVALVGYASPASGSQVVFVPQQDRDRWDGWGFGYGLGGSASGDGNAAGLEYGMGSVLFGAERHLDGARRIGVFGGYQGTSLTLKGPRQTGTINGGMFGGYVYNDDGFNYYTAITGLQLSGYDTERFVQFDGINRTASGSFGGWQGYGYLERGVNFGTVQSSLQPYVAMQYTYLRQNGYTETDAGSLNLDVGGIDANSLRSFVGVRMRSNRGLASGRWMPELRALWLHEFLDTDVAVNSSFAPISGGSFAVEGLNLGRDWAIVGGGLRCDLASGWSLYGNYDAQVNNRHVFHVGSGGIQYAW